MGAADEVSRALGAGTTGYLVNSAVAPSGLVPPEKESVGGKGAERERDRAALKGTERIIAQLVAKNPFAGRAVPEVEVPPRPRLASRTPMEAQVRTLQRYISAFQYNHLPKTFFNCCKYRPLTRLLDTARDVIRYFLPIRCLEATILAVYLTQELKELERVPLTFKTSFQGATYRHIVLGVRHACLWGALGLSRKDDLMYKKMTRRSLMELLDDFIKAYRGHGHEVINVKLGLPVSHVSTSTTIPCWRFVSVNLANMSDEDRLLVEEIAHKFDTSCVKLSHEYEKNPGTPTFVIKTKRPRDSRRAQSLPPPVTRRKRESIDGASAHAGSPLPCNPVGSPLQCAPSPCGDDVSWLGSTADSTANGGLDISARTLAETPLNSSYVGSDTAESSLALEGGGMSGDADDGDDNDSVDSVEENDERIKCLLAGRSPFRRNQFTAPVVNTVRAVAAAKAAEQGRAPGEDRHERLGCDAGTKPTGPGRAGGRVQLKQG